jgi:SAM-dependent methyltransferase
VTSPSTNGALLAHRGAPDELAGLLPPEIAPLIDHGFVRSCELHEEYVAVLAYRVARDLGLIAACEDSATVDEAIARAGLDRSIARAPTTWLARTLAARGWLAHEIDNDGEERFRAAVSGPTHEPEEFVAEQTAHDARALPAYRMAAHAASRYPAVLLGEMSGEEALLSPDAVAAWQEYFSNDNPLYAISNAVGAIAANDALALRAGPVLELGGGLGSGAAALLERLARPANAGEVPAYRFTEVFPAFLRRARKTLLARWPRERLSFGQLDIDRPFAQAGVEEGAYALVYGVNVLHVAHDLAATLTEIRRTLVPGGAAVFAECVRPFAGRPVYVEFVFQLFASFRNPVLEPSWRPNGGFLTPEQWTAAFAANGFAEVRIVPDVAAIRDVVPSFVVAAITARCE